MLLPRDMIRRCAQNYPDKTAYICGDKKASWSEMDRRSDRLAGALQSLGLKHGDTIAVLAPETIEVYEHFFACMKLGLRRVGVNNRYAWPEIEHVLKDSSTRALLVHTACLPLIADHMAEISALNIILIGMGEGHGPVHGLAHDYETLLERTPAPDNYPAIAADDVLFISYTSGTTGFPKGVLLTHGASTDVILHSLISFGFTPDDIWYQPAASAWVVVIMSCFNLGNGMTTAIPDGGFEIVKFLHEISRHQVTTVLLVPTMLNRAIALVRDGDYDLESLRLIIYGSSPATPKLIRDASEALKVDLLQTYALTETTGGWVTFLTPADHVYALANEPGLLRSVGRVGVHFDISIRDDQGRELMPGEKGEIWLRGSTLMTGYLNQVEATSEVLNDGWLATNDIGRVDDRGFVYLMDRKKFMIITGGINVFPTAVEAIAIEHPAVEEIAVVGVPHPEWGEAVVGVVKRAAGFETVQGQELMAFCAEHLGKPETPKHIVFTNEIPKTANAKIKKTEIREWLKNTPGLVPWDVDPNG